MPLRHPSLLFPPSWVVSTVPSRPVPRPVPLACWALQRFFPRICPLGTWLPSLVLKFWSLLNLGLKIGWWTAWDSPVRIRKGVLLWERELDAVPEWKNYFCHSDFEAVCWEKLFWGLCVMFHLMFVFWPSSGDFSLGAAECACVLLDWSRPLL